MALYEEILSPRAPVSSSASPTLDAWADAVAEQVAPDDDSVLSSDDEIWDHVESCPGAEADKAAVLRTSLASSLGKQHAQKVLKKTKATVARNSEGHKTRVLQVDKKYLRLKT